MKSRLYEIAYVGLKEGDHSFEYLIDNRFLEMMGYDGESLRDFKCKVLVDFNKGNNLFQLHFDLDGQATVACDRCGDDLELTIWDEHDLVIKLTFDDNVVETIDDDEVVIMPRSETVIDLSTWIYEYILLSIPIQHVHSEDENGKSLCNEDVLKILSSHQSQVEENHRHNLWKGLDNLKNNKDNN